MIKVNFKKEEEIIASQANTQASESHSGIRINMPSEEEKYFIFFEKDSKSKQGATNFLT